jgi:DNA-binding protein H-NS
MSIEQQANETIDEIAAQDPETAQRLVKSFEQWETAREFRKKESKRTSEQLAARIAQFAEAMNVGHSTTSDQVLKLSVVESRWQDLEDAREERKQVAAACRDAIRAAEQKIKDIIQTVKSTQLSLFQSSAGSADDAGVDDDAGQD